MCCPDRRGVVGLGGVPSRPQEWHPKDRILNVCSKIDLVELDAAEANEHTLIAAEIRRLQIAHWADLHPGEAMAESRAFRPNPAAAKQ
jgi:hypothetical protein